MVEPTRLTADPPPPPAESQPEHRDLVTQRDYLRLQGCSGAEQIAQGADEEAAHRARAFPQVPPASMTGVRMEFPGGTRSLHRSDKAQAREHFCDLRANVRVEGQECGIDVQGQRNVHCVVRPQAPGTSHLG